MKKIIIFLLALAPTFEMNPMKKKILAAKGGRVIIECKPKAAPKPKFSWSKGTEWLVNGSRSVQKIENSIGIHYLEKFIYRGLVFLLVMYMFFVPTFLHRRYCSSKMNRNTYPSLSVFTIIRV